MTEYPHNIALDLPQFKRHRLCMLRNDIPPPAPASRHHGSRCKYPWPDMAVNDSFAVHIHNLGVTRASANAWGKRHGRSFLVAQHSDGTYRCWRVR